MTPEFQSRGRTLILILVLFATMRSFGQVYRANGTDYYPYYGKHLVGSGAFQFGFQEYGFLTDADGEFVWDRMQQRSPQPGDTYHRLTKIYLGPVSFSVPLRPWPFFIICGAGLAAALALADFSWKQLRRKRQELKGT